MISAYIFPGLDNPQLSLKRTEEQKAATIIKTVCDYFNITDEHIKHRCREREFVYPRQLAIYFIINNTKLHQREIGTLFGGYDRTTIRQNYYTIKDRLQVEEEVRSAINIINSLI